MKKTVSLLFAFLLIASLCVTGFAADEKQYLVDRVGYLNETEAAAVESRLSSLSDELDMDFVIVTTDDLGTNDITGYADDFFDYNGYGIGRQGDRSGVLLLVYDTGLGYTKRWISTSGYGIEAFTDYGIQYVGKQLVPLMDDGKWEEAFMKFADLSEDLVGRANKGRPLDETPFNKDHEVLKGVLIALVVGIVVAFIITKMVKSSYKPVRFKANATDYLVQGSLQVTGAFDNFRTTSVTRTAIESKSSSGGSSTHSSSSGRSHGGGGF